MSAHSRVMVLQSLTAWVPRRDTPPYSFHHGRKGKKRYTTGEDLEAIFEDDDSIDEQFDCESNVEAVPDSAECESDSDLDKQITQIIYNIEIEDKCNKEVFEHYKTTYSEAVKLPGM